jgi:hypothetical protein
MHFDSFAAKNRQFRNSNSPDEIFRLKPRKIVPICKGAGRYFRAVYSTNRYPIANRFFVALRLTKMNKADASSGQRVPQMEVLAPNFGGLTLVAADRPDRYNKCDASQSRGTGARAMRALAFSLPLLFIAAGGALSPQSLSAAPAFVQINSVCPQSTPPQTPLTVSVAYTATQTAGNLNVVIVGWNDITNSVSSVTDSQNNAYQLAVGPTTRTTLLTQSIYYAKNIKGGSIR